MKRTGFTLIELLVVVTIIAVLAAMLMPVLSMIWRSARIMATSKRIEAISQGLGGMAIDGLTPAQVIHRQALRQVLNTLGTSTGVLDFGNSVKTDLGDRGRNTTYERMPIDPVTQQAIITPDGNWFPATPGASFPFIIGFPWGRPTFGIATAPTPVPLALNQFCPKATRELLALSLGTTSTGWFSDRSPRAPWNDVWGNPLVVAFAIYQPRKASAAPFDTTLKAAQEMYRSTLSVYISVGSAGPRLDTPLTGDPVANTTALWNQITSRANANLWTEGSYVKPPWTGVRSVRQGGIISLLGAPLEIQ